jgi:hypothetical protein
MLAFLMAPQKVPLPWTRGPDEVAPARNGFPLPAEASLSIRGLQQQLTVLQQRHRSNHLLVLVFGSGSCGSSRFKERLSDLQPEIPTYTYAFSLGLYRFKHRHQR